MIRLSTYLQQYKYVKTHQRCTAQCWIKLELVTNMNAGLATLSTSRLTVPSRRGKRAKSILHDIPKPEKGGN